MDKFRNLIDNYYDKLWVPTLNKGNLYNELIHQRTKDQLPEVDKGNNYRVYRVNLFLDDIQKKNLLFMMRKTTEMYNATVKHLNKLKNEDKEEYKNSLNFFKLRKELLKVKRDISGGKIDIHILDAAIKHAVTSFNSAESNRHPDFKVKPQRQNRNNRIIEIDADRFKTPGVIKRIFGKEIKCKLDRKPFRTELIKSSCLIKYCKQKRRFTLIVNQNLNQEDRKIELTNKVKKELDNFHIDKKILKKFDYNNYKVTLKDEVIPEPKYEFSSLDPGFSTFVTCLTNKDYEFYGKEIYDRVKDMLTKYRKKLEKIKNRIKNLYDSDDEYSLKVYKRIKRKIKRKVEKKIKNIVDDFQWKTIDKLTKTSKEIIIGNMSSKKIVETNNFEDITKDAMLRMNHFKFRQRLKYKCKLRNRVYICVDENNTTKTCSICGSTKVMTLQDRIYECKCDEHPFEIQIQRDINSCRGIWIKSMDRNNFKKV